MDYFTIEHVPDHGDSVASHGPSAHYGSDDPVAEADVNHDGRIDEWDYDVNHDGQVDTIDRDTDGDGVVDAVYQDGNGDGRIDWAALDTDHDGHIDVIKYDSDYDGYYDVAIDHPGPIGEQGDHHAIHERVYGAPSTRTYHSR